MVSKELREIKKLKICKQLRSFRFKEGVILKSTPTSDNFYWEMWIDALRKRAHPKLVLRPGKRKKEPAVG